jgi:tetratricopeptide (TPR) repeat protein
MTLNKEMLTFVGALVFVGAMIALGGGDGGSGRGRGGRGAPPQNEIQAKFSPGRFVPVEDSTWDGSARNVYEAPSDLRPLPPLPIAAPPFDRVAVPAPPTAFPLGSSGEKALRRPFAVDKDGLKRPAADPFAGAASAAADPLGIGDAPANGTTDLVDPYKQLSPAERAAMTTKERLALEAEAARRSAAAKAKEATLDRLSFTTGTSIMGEFVGSEDRKANRYEVKKAFADARGATGISESERNDRLKKFRIVFAEVRGDRRSKAAVYDGDKIADIQLADNAVNRYHERRLVSESEGKGIDAYVDAMKPLWAERRYELVAAELARLRARGLTSVDAYRMAADAYDALFDYNAALTVCREAAAKHQDSASILARLGAALARLGLKADAEEAFQKALALDSADFAANLGYGELLLRDRRAQAAAPRLREAVNSSKADPRLIEAARLSAAEAALAIDDFRNAQAQTDLVLDRFKGGEDPAGLAPERRRLHARALALSAMTALAQGRVGEARTIAWEGVKAHAGDGLLAYVLGTVALVEGKLSDAKLQMDSVPALDPMRTARALAAAAQIFELTGDDSKAAENAQVAATSADPSDLRLRASYARALLNIGEYDRATEQYLLALDDRPDDVDVLVGLGDAAYRGGRLPDATRFYDRAAALEAGFPDLLARRIVTLVRRPKLADAEKLVAESGGSAAKSAMLQAAVAYFHYAKGNHDEALGMLQRLGDSAPPEVSPLSRYGKDVFAAVRDHKSRELWTDQFGRTGAQIGREWKLVRGAGPNVALAEQAVRFEGKHSGVSDRPTVLYQERQGDRVYSYSVDLALEAPLPGVYVCVGVVGFSKVTVKDKWPGFQERDGGFAAFGGLQIAVGPDGRMVKRLLEKSKMGEWEEIPGTPENPKSLNVEFRQVDAREGKWDVLVNRETVLREVVINDLKRWRRALELQVSCHGALGSDVRFTVDNASITTVKEER